MADTTAPHHERDVRVGGQALTSNVDRASVPGDGSAGVEGGQPGPGAGVEAAAVDLQNLDDLPADLVDQPAARGPAGGDGRSRAQRAVEVPCSWLARACSRRPRGHSPIGTKSAPPR
jgi:hypothetical protein